MRILQFFGSACLVAAAAASIGATDCGGGITRDPGFDLWCGQDLCAWKIQRGEIRRVPTWHVEDFGVELLDGTSIEQFTPVDNRDGDCIRFDLIADVAETADVSLGVDIYGDGTIERAFAVPTAHWKPVSFAFSLSKPFTGVRFEIAKRGAGRAVVARMHAAVVEGGCTGIAPISGGKAPLAAICYGNLDCQSGLCAAVDIIALAGGGRCAGCEPAAPMCGGGQVCGLLDPGPAERPVPIACVATGRRVLGEQCLKAAECASGICSFGVCSACSTEGSACGGAVCGQAYDHGPTLCRPGEGAGARGAPCATSADCASGACRGAERRQCLDGRSCATDANCPPDGSLRPGPCLPVGVQGGSCD